VKPQALVASVAALTVGLAILNIACSGHAGTSRIARAATQSSTFEPAASTTPTCANLKVTVSVMASQKLSTGEQHWINQMVSELRAQDRASARWDKISDKSYNQKPGKPYLVVYVLDGHFGPTVAAISTYPSGLVDKEYWTSSLDHEGFDICQHQVIPAAPG
jgi:hypothetical protein